MKPFATWRRHVREWPKICARNANSSWLFSSATMASSTGPLLICVGLLSKDYPAQQIVFQDAINAIEGAAGRLGSLDQQRQPSCRTGR
jgi:hypothetical protein